MPEDREVILYCGNGHKKVVPESYWRDWNAEHGAGSVMMCRRCDDKEMLLPVEQIPRPHFDWILAKAAQIEEQEAIANNHFKEKFVQKPRS